MANPAPTINQINAFNATQGTTIDFNIVGGTELVRSNRIYIYDLSDNSLICTHLYVSTESIHELPPNTDSSIVYESGKSSADFVNGAQYYAQIQTFTDIGGTEGGSGLSVAKMFWCLVDPTLTITTIPSTISTTSYNVSATYNANTSVVSNIIQQYQFSLYSATGSLLQSSGVVVGSGEQQGTSTAYDISYNFSGLSVGSSYYVVVDVTTTQGMSVSAQSNTFTVSIDTPTLGEATVVNNACDGYISVTSNLSSEYGGSGSGEIVSFETDSENVFTKLQVTFSPTQTGSGTPSPSNVRPIYGVGGVEVNKNGKNLFDQNIFLDATGWTEEDGVYHGSNSQLYNKYPISFPIDILPYEGQLTFSFDYHNANVSYRSGYMYFRYTDGTENYLELKSVDWKHLTFTTALGKTVNGIIIGVSNSLEIFLKNVQLELGTTATTYEPYTEQTVSQEFDVSLTPTSKDTDPYLFKAVGDIYGDRLEEDIVGGTVNWNQQLPSSYGWPAVDSEFVNGVKIIESDSSNGLVKIQVDTGGATATRNIQIGSDLTLFSGGHFILLRGCPSGGSASTYFYGISASSTSQFRPDTGNGGYLYNYTSGFNLNISIRSGCPAGTYIFRPQFIDLTAMFGTTIADYVYSLEQATAGSGIAWLKSYGFFTKPYYEYDTGTLKSVNPTAHVTRGVNAWDEEWEVGGISSSTGANYTSTSAIRSKNYIPVIPNTTYYFKSGTLTPVFCGYDADKNFIAGTFSGYNTATLKDVAYLIPSGVYYLRFNAYGTTYNNDICINISDPTINGQYFPYEEHTYTLGDVTLRGIPKLVNNELVYDGDIRKYDGTVTRKYGIVDLGTLTWGYYNNSYFAATMANNMKTTTACFASKYVNGGNIAVADMADKTCRGSNNSNAVYVKDSAYSDAATFKTAMSGVYLVYELATPTTETTTPFEQIQEVSKYGTLEYITSNNVPVGHNTTYLTRDVFGGYVDLVSGVLVVDRAMVTLDGSADEGWSVGTSGTHYRGYTYALSDIKPHSSNLQPTSAICDKIETGTWNSAFGGVLVLGQTAKAIGFGLDSLGITNYTDLDIWLSNNPITICYELATPLTYQLTPQQIQTLVGTNNVWSEQGDIELSYHIPITNLLVKRQDVDDVSGNWLTLYSQPVEQASDMDFTFIDFLNQYGKTYKYALVPLLTQTQSGVEVEVEGGYTVSDEVQSIFDGVFISDSTGSHKCKANVGYGNVNMNQSVGSITPIGLQYPIIITNSNNRYHNGSISGMIVPDDYYYNGNLSRIDMVNKRNELEQFLTNKRAKIIKDWNSNIWLVMIMDNIDCSFDNNYGMGIVTFNANWLEVGDPTNQEDLQATGLVDVGGV